MSKHPFPLPDQVRKTPPHLILFGFLLCGNLLNYLDRQLFLSLFPLFRTRFSLSDPMLGVLASSFTLVYVISAPLAGYLIRKLPPGILLGSGILVFSAGMAISGVAPTLPLLFLGRMLTGFGEATLTTLGPFFLLGSLTTGKGVRLGIFFSAIPLGSAFGFALGAYFPGYMDFQSVLLLPVIPGILLGALTWFLFRSEMLPVPSQHVSVRTMKHFWKRIALSFSLQTLVTFVLGGMAAWISVYLTRSKHFELSTANMMPGIALVLGGVSGMILGGRFLDRERAGHDGKWGSMTTLWGFSISILGIAGVLFGKNEISVGLGLVCSTFGLFLVTVPINWLILSWQSPLEAAPIMGWGLLVSHFLGDLPSPTLIGWISQNSTLDHALLVVLFIPVALGVGLAWNSRHLVLHPRE